jgi:hypothetical protein
MAITLPNQPYVNNRIADVFAKAKTHDKLLKLISTIAKLTADFMPNRINAQATSDLAKKCSSARSVIKFFDFTQDFQTPGDSYSKIMNTTFAGSDLIGASLFVKDLGFYSLSDEVKNKLENTSTGLAFLGMITGFVKGILDFKKELSDNLKLSTNKDQSKVLDSVNELKLELSKLKNTVGSGQASHELNDQISKVETQIKDFEYLMMGQKISADRLFKAGISIVEKLFDIAALLLTVLPNFIDKLDPYKERCELLAKGLSVVTSGIAISKIWKDTAVSKEASAIYSSVNDTKFLSKFTEAK